MHAKTNQKQNENHVLNWTKVTNEETLRGMTMKAEPVKKEKTTVEKKK